MRCPAAQCLSRLLPAALAGAAAIAPLLAQVPAPAAPRAPQPPFDRLLVAQARHLSVPLLTADATLAAYPVETLLVGDHGPRS